MEYVHKTILSYDKKVSEYDQEMPQSQTTYEPIAQRGRVEQYQRYDNKNTIKVKQAALSFPARLM